MIVTIGEVLRRRLARPRPDPDPRRDDVVHPPPVRRAGARARGPRRRRPARPAPRAAGRRPGQRHQPGGRPGRQLRPGADAATSGPSTSPTTSMRPRRCARRWERQLPDVPLVIVESPYRAVISPVVAYLDILDQAWPPDKEAPITIVVLPEYVARHWWDRLLYNQTAKRLKAALVGREHTVIADVPYRGEVTDRSGRDPPERLESSLIGGRRPLQGRKPADRRVRVERPHAPYFRYTGPGQLVAKPARQRRPHPDRPRCSRACAASSSAARCRTRRRSASGCQEEGARDLQLGRHQLVRLRDRGDPAGPRPRRRERAVPVDPGRRSRSPSCSPSSRSRTARSAAPTRTAAARTSSPRPTSRRSSG